MNRFNRNIPLWELPGGRAYSVDRGVDMSSQKDSEIIERAKEIIISQDLELKRIAEDATELATVSGIEKEFVYIEVRGTSYRVKNPKIKLDINDKVVIEPRTKQIIEKVTSSKKITKIINKVEWDDIVGIDSAKQQMREVIDFPHQYKDIYKHYNKKPAKGILLYGAPGCGKTMLGKAAATSISKLNGSSGEGGFIYIKSTEILDKYYGESESKIRSIFAEGKKHFIKHKYPAIIFIDECDSILGSRSSNSRINDSLVTTFLTEMDGLEESPSIVVLATNRPDVLDSAITRNGRVDRKIKVTRPTIDDAKKLISQLLMRIPINDNIDINVFSLDIAMEIYHQKYSLYKVNIDNYSLQLTLGHIINPAMIIDVIDMAISIALHCDISGGNKTGLIKDDFYQAIYNMQQQNKDIKHGFDGDTIHMPESDSLIYKIA